MGLTPEFKILGKLVRHLRAVGYEPVLVGGWRCLDFPLQASGVLEESNSIELGANLRLAVASLAQLAALKEIAVRDRNRPEDALDLAFIRSKLQQ